MTTNEQAKSQVVVSDIRPWSEHGGWSWVATFTDGQGDEGVTCYRTDSNGQGLFHRAWHENNWNQSHGHMQYSMPATEAGLKRRLRKLYAEHGEVTFESR